MGLGAAFGFMPEETKQFRMLFMNIILETVVKVGVTNVDMGVLPYAFAGDTLKSSAHPRSYEVYYNAPVHFNSS